MLGRLGMVAVLAAVVVRPGIAAQAPSLGRLVVVAEPEHVVTLASAEEREGRVGRLTLLVRNESTSFVQLRVRFFADGGDGPTRLKPVSDTAFSADKPALYTNRSNLATGRLRVPPWHTVLVPLRFGVADEAKADVVNGILVVAAQANPRVQSAAVWIIGQLPAAEAPPPNAQPRGTSSTMTEATATLLQKLGAGGFGVLMGWLLYFVNRYRKGVHLTDLATIAGAIGGGAVLTLFPAKTDLFGAYGIGLFIGFFAYFAVLLVFVAFSRNFGIDWFLDGRRRKPTKGDVIPPGTADTVHPMEEEGGLGQ